MLSLPSNSRSSSCGFLNLDNYSLGSMAEYKSTDHVGNTEFTQASVVIVGAGISGSMAHSSWLMVSSHR
jgi:hypothetical protein